MACWFFVCLCKLQLQWYPRIFFFFVNYNSNEILLLKNVSLWQIEGLEILTAWPAMRGLLSPATISRQTGQGPDTCLLVHSSRPFPCTGVCEPAPPHSPVSQPTTGKSQPGPKWAGFPKWDTIKEQRSEAAVNDFNLTALGFTDLWDPRKPQNHTCASYSQNFLPQKLKGILTF